MATLPAPLIPAEVDLRHYPAMSLDVQRLRDSRFAATVTGEAFRCGLMLWCAAWHQAPAGSLPDDDVELSVLAGWGRAVTSWLEHRTGALYGWVRCSDGRLYHPVVAEKVVEAWNSTLFHRWKKEADRIRKENKAREERGLPPLETPAKPLEIRVGTSASSGLPERSDGHGVAGDGPETPGPTTDAGPGEVEEPHPEPVPAETMDVSNGNPAETALNGTERNGIDLSCPKRAPPVRTRRSYPEDFERFWAGYPTDPNMSKAKAGEAWDRLVGEDRQAALAAVAGFVAYCRGKPDYRPVHAVRFLTERRFDGFAPKQAALDLKFGTVDEDRVDFGGGRVVPDATVIAVVSRGEWLDDWGPRYGKPGCRLPQRLVRMLEGQAA